MIYDNRAHYIEGLDQSGDIVAMHQIDYCARCNCDLGGGDCAWCNATQNGWSVCGYCGKDLGPNYFREICPETIVKEKK